MTSEYRCRKRRRKVCRTSDCHSYHEYRNVYKRHELSNVARERYCIPYPEYQHGFFCSPFLIDCSKSPRSHYSDAGKYGHDAYCLSLSESKAHIPYDKLSHYSYSNQLINTCRSCGQPELFCLKQLCCSPASICV